MGARPDSVGPVSVLAVIPARMESTRFPGKPLAELGGVPMVVCVLRAVERARTVQDVVVATDSEQIHAAVLAHGGACLMTRAEHPTGTDRVAEVAAQSAHDLVLNVQGDEPLISPEAIDQLVMGFGSGGGFVMGTLVRPLRDPALIADPNHVKVTVQADGSATAFSRHPIPAGPEPDGSYLKHIGVYLFRRSFLLGYPNLPESAWERRERLEQLRVLDAGHRIKAVRTTYVSHNVETLADLRRVDELRRRELAGG